MDHQGSSLTMDNLKAFYGLLHQWDGNKDGSSMKKWASK